MNVHEARRLALRSQLLCSPRLPRGIEGAARAIEHLGYVQVDTIAVVERAHHHTLWSRVPGYQPQMLDELLRRRRVFEYWGHAASYLPLSDYRYFRRKMRTSATDNPWWRRFASQHGRLMDAVLARVRREGPLGAADFAPTRRQRSGWWDWKPAKTALETLHTMGLLMVAERRNFQRIFDLTERVLPRGADTREPEPAEIARFCVRRCLQSHGLATAREVRDHIWLATQAEIDAAVAELLDSGEVTPVGVTGIPDQNYFALTAALNRRPRPQMTAVHVLSPFDNLIIQRPRLRTLFGFDYTLECYVPAPKRRHGYFVLPVLCGTEFVGRIDAKVERKAATLCIRRLSFTPDTRPSAARLAALAARLGRFARFNQASRVELGAVSPVRLKPPLRQLLEPAVSESARE